MHLETSRVVEGPVRSEADCRPGRAGDGQEGQSSRVVVRPVQSAADCRAVVDLTGRSFPEECGTPGAKGGAGLNLRQWTEIEHEDLVRQPWLWPHIGLAVEQAADGDKVLGAVVLSFENEKDGTISYWEVSKRVGCLSTVHNWLYDQILEEPLKAEECLIDFIAVGPDARGKGVGALLMAWAQETGAATLLEKEPEAVAAHGPLMSLWVAADNAVALKLYKKSGYQVTRKTDDGVCHCIMSHMLKSFLGHPVWYKMSKPLPVPAAAAIIKPVPVSIPISATAAGRAAVTIASNSAAAASAASTASNLGCGVAAEVSPTSNMLSAAVNGGTADGTETGNKILAHRQPSTRLESTPQLSSKELPGQGGEDPCGMGPGGKAGILAGTVAAMGSCDRNRSSAGGSAPLSSSSQGAAPLLELVRTLSNTVAAASIAYMARRTSESESSSQAPAALVVKVV